MQFKDVGGGVIDSDYRGPVVVLLFNFSNIHFEVRKGQRFAQIMFQKLLIQSLGKCNYLKTVELFATKVPSVRQEISDRF